MRVTIKAATNERWRRLLRFALVGAATALFYYVALYFLVEYSGMQVVWASSVVYLVALLLNYSLHYSWTFQATASHQVTSRRYLIMVGVGFLFNLVAMSYGVKMVGMHYLIVQTLAIGVIVTWNYLAGSLWVYRSVPEVKP